MNANLLARLAVVCTLALAASAGAEAKGSLSIGATIVSSCAGSTASVYNAVATGGLVAARGDVAMKAGCTSDMAYTVSTSQAGRQASASREQNDAGDIVVTLTY